MTIKEGIIFNKWMLMHYRKHYFKFPSCPQCKQPIECGQIVKIQQTNHVGSGQKTQYYHLTCWKKMEY